MTAGESPANSSSSSPQGRTTDGSNDNNTTSNNNDTMATDANNNSASLARWSGLETDGMKDARCSLLLQEEVPYDARIKVLPKQRVLVCQDKGFYNLSSSSDHHHRNFGNGSNSNEDNFYVDFKGTTVLQLEPGMVGQHKTMPVTLTVGGRCHFTAENYQDFRVMMRTRAQSMDMNMSPNGNFDWPDVESLLLCPCCGRKALVPPPDTNSNLNTRTKTTAMTGQQLQQQQQQQQPRQEYWLVFYPLLQITLLKGTQMTLGTRTICRLTCLDCMEDLLEGLTLRIQPGKPTTDPPQPPPINNNNNNTNTTDGGANGDATMATGNNNNNNRGVTRLVFTLPAADVLAEAGSASFLEDAPPRPDSHPLVDDLLDAWTLYNLWEHTGAWEALQNDYRLVLSRSMHPEHDNNNNDNNASANHGTLGSGGGRSGSGSGEPRLKDRLGKPCGNPACGKIHGTTDEDGDIIRLAIKCRECLSEYYCSRACREAHAQQHQPVDCQRKQRDREERRDRRTKRVQCDTCQKKYPYTKMKKCSRCRKATYCSVECQRADWDKHKALCKKAM